MARGEAKELTKQLKKQRRDKPEVHCAELYDVIETWLASKTMMSASGIARYQSHANHWKRFFGERLALVRFYQITKREVELYRDARLRELSAKKRDGHCEKTVYCELTALRQLMRWAMDQEPPYIAKDPTHNVELPPVPPPVNRAYTEEQQRKILALAASDPRLTLQLMLGFYAGLRREGIAKLRVADVYLNEAVPFLRVEEKGRHTRLGSGARKQRDVPLAAELQAAFRQCPPVEGSEYWFGEMDRNGMDRMGAALCDVCRRATGLKGLAARLHNSRHSFCTNLNRNGVDLPVVARLAGHASIRTTMIYRSVTTQDMADAIAKLSG
jgi:integrase